VVGKGPVDPAGMTGEEGLTGPGEPGAGAIGCGEYGPGATPGAIGVPGDIAGPAGCAAGTVTTVLQCGQDTC
jgi:hypothetical protein